MEGRNPFTEGYPLKLAELISQLEAPRYVARFALNTPTSIAQAKEGVKKALQNQIDGRGYSFVELLSNCPTNWKMTPPETLKFITSSVSKYFVPGVYKDVDGGL